MTRMRRRLTVLACCLVGAALLPLLAGALVAIGETLHDIGRSGARRERLVAALGPGAAEGGAALDLLLAASATRGEVGGIRLVRLDGPPYVRGVAFGRLAHDECRGVLVDLMDGFDSFAARRLAGGAARRLGLSGEGLVAGAVEAYLGLPGVIPLLRWWYLDEVWGQLRPFVPAHMLAEAQGLADGADVPLERVLRLLVLSEVLSAGCSSLAVWGPATVDGKLRHYRNLDWELSTRVQRHPVLVEQAPAQGRRGFLSLTFGGFPWCLQGVNAAGLTLGEVGASCRLRTYHGQPMVVRLRRILEEAGNLDEVTAIMEEGNRTRGYNFVVGHLAGPDARAYETNRDAVAVFEADDPRERAHSAAWARPGMLLRTDWAVDRTLRAVQRAAGGGGDPRGSQSYEQRYRPVADALRQRGDEPLDTAAVLELARRSGLGSQNLVSVTYAPEGISFAYADDSRRAVERSWISLPWSRLRWVKPPIREGTTR